ncbi:hypothetical protein LSAT2_027708 [Lamellibrachia satsuma]|nr:hypothetical protein LSAT2_027708 [Lamellibrachia satsuma]
MHGYNSTTHKNSYGVGQAASQAIGAAIEWQTGQHQIVGFHLENKLCKTTWIPCWTVTDDTTLLHERDDLDSLLDGD